MWDAIEHVDDGELWEAHQTLKARLIDFTRRRVVRQAERRGEPSGDGRAAAARAEPRRADDRLRPALRDLQARQPAAPGPRGASRRSSTIRSGRCSSSSPARRIRRMVPARPCCGRLRSSRATRLCRQDRLHRGLRHQRRPAPGAGRGRLAEQPAATARGVRHERSEGGAERRAEPLGARRLVGRGLRRTERIRHRDGRDALVAGGARPAGRRGPAVACCATRSCRCTTSATATGCRATGSRG